jgi:hypothetical protein
MKTLKFFLFVMLALGMSMACSEDDTPGQKPDDSQERDALKNKLLGEWVVSGEKYSYIYAFADDDTIYIKNLEGDTINRWPYQAIAEDSIQITRYWITHNKVFFYSSNSFWIRNFIPSLAAVYPPQFGDVVLERCLNDKMKLTGTKWKLGALVDIQTGESIEPEPKECNKCYTLEFDSDTTAIGISVLNELRFIVTASNIKVLAMTKIGDGINNNVDLFYDALLTIDTYEYSKDELKIYYDRKNKYLLYKLLLQ